jgi:phospholipid/cholesterol/gamma-HCH transport system substrate-binding protein
MKKISHEVMVGGVALIIIVAFILLYNFLKGSALFTSTDTYYIVYNNIAGLTESNPVEINGYQAGVVQDIKLINDGSGRILVSISVDRHFNIPKGTQAEITTATLIAGMKIILRMGDSSEMCHNHDTLGGYVATSIIDRLTLALPSLEGNISDMIMKLDSVISKINDVFTPQFGNDIKSTISNVNDVTAGLREITDSEKDALKASLEDLKKFTAMLSANSSSLDTTIKNLAAVSDTIASSDLASTLSSLKSSLAHLDELVKGISQGEGSAGKLIKDEGLYTNLNNTLSDLDELLRDLKENPKKYVHFSLFGKKDN